MEYKIKGTFTINVHANNLSQAEDEIDEILKTLDKDIFLIELGDIERVEYE